MAFESLKYFSELLYGRLLLLWTRLVKWGNLSPCHQITGLFGSNSFGGDKSSNGSNVSPRSSNNEELQGFHWTKSAQLFSSFMKSISSKNYFSLHCACMMLICVVYDFTECRSNNLYHISNFFFKENEFNIVIIL